MVNVKEYSRRFKEKSLSSRNVIAKRGKLPLIITAGHGGKEKPGWIPDRKQEGSLLLADMYTKEIADAIGDEIRRHYQHSPHVILNLISRRKVDVNRPIQEGAETKIGEQVWTEYHNHIQDAVDCVLKDHKYGLLLDIHGHTHEHGMLELGYLLEPTDLKLHPAKLDKVILEKSSLKALAKRHAHHTKPHLLLRKSIGDSISTDGVNFTVVPSSVKPAPDNVYYFSGGYTTQKYHQIKKNDNGLDVIQIEVPKHLRHENSGRQYIIQATARAIIDILDNFYLNKSRL